MIYIHDKQTLLKHRQYLILKWGICNPDRVIISPKLFRKCFSVHPHASNHATYASPKNSPTSGAAVTNSIHGLAASKKVIEEGRSDLRAQLTSVSRADGRRFKSPSKLLFSFIQANPGLQKVCIIVIASHVIYRILRTAEGCLKPFPTMACRFGTFGVRIVV